MYPRGRVEASLDRTLTGALPLHHHEGMSDDRIIDLQAYLEGRDDDFDEAPLALWGTEGDRRRFILPLWRMSFIAEAGWAGLVRENGPDDLEIVVVVDQREEPARPEPGRPLPALVEGDLAPSVRVTEAHELVVALGKGPRGRRWVIVLLERPPDAEGLDADDREDVIYLAGECAGLVELIER